MVPSCPDIFPANESAKSGAPVPATTLRIHLPQMARGGGAAGRACLPRSSGRLSVPIGAGPQYACGDHYPEVGHPVGDIGLSGDRNGRSHDAAYPVPGIVLYGPDYMGRDETAPVHRGRPPIVGRRRKSSPPWWLNDIIGNCRRCVCHVVCGDLVGPALRLINYFDRSWLIR